ncbi:unnamed protein product [Rodentolepis nana]|uniref:Ion_trans domain-containing protein n=1 Tax=Rodentolepis nana TaxID=102285 RepID=A0A0R3TM93_RODNA|nr:unnamed protein product [Rodentolepis nana]
MTSKMAFLDFEDEAEIEGEDGAFKDSIIEPVYRQKLEKTSSTCHQGRAPTLTIEVVRVSRPLKVISLLLAVVALVLMIIASCFANWMYIGPSQMGLFHECFPEDVESVTYTCTKTNCYSCEFLLHRNAFGAGGDVFSATRNSSLCVWAFGLLSGFQKTPLQCYRRILHVSRPFLYGLLNYFSHKFSDPILR